MPSSILQILQSTRVSPATRRVLEERMDLPSAYAPTFFSPQEFHLLVVLIRAVLPQQHSHVPIAPGIDQRLSLGEGNGWRYAVLPSDPQAYRSALHTLQSALSVMGDDPAELPQSQIVTLLNRVQRKELDTTEFALSLWLESFKFDVVRTWLAHPDAMELLHYDGFADELNQPQVAAAGAAK